MITIIAPPFRLQRLSKQSTHPLTNTAIERQTCSTKFRQPYCWFEYCTSRIPRIHESQLQNPPICKRVDHPLKPNRLSGYFFSNPGKYSLQHLSLIFNQIDHFALCLPLFLPGTFHSTQGCECLFPGNAQLSPYFSPHSTKQSDFFIHCRSGWAPKLNRAQLPHTPDRILDASSFHLRS